MTKPFGDLAITCVIPTYRRPRFLRRAIRSVLNQTYSHIRLMINDNASGDETFEVVNEFARNDDRIEYHCQSSNIGPAANIGDALARVTTPLFSLLGDDDVLLPAFYTSAVQALSAHPEAVFYCARTVVDQLTTRVFMRRYRGWPGGVYHPSVETVEHMIENHFVSTGVVFRTRIQDTIGPLGSYASDRSYVIVAAAQHPFVVSEEEQAVFTVHPTSFSSGIATNDREPQGVAFLLDMHRETVEGLQATRVGASSFDALRSLLERHARSHVVAEAVLHGVRDGRWGEAETLRRRAAEVRLHPLVTAFVQAVATLGRTRWTRFALRVPFRVITSVLAVVRMRRQSKRDADRSLREYVDCLDRDSSFAR